MYVSFRKLKNFGLAFSLAGALIVPAAFADHDKDDSHARVRENRNTSPDVSRSMVRQVQQQLKNRGFYTGPIDGSNGSQTRMAIQKFQRSENIVETGELNDATLKSLGVERAQRESQGEASRSVEEPEQGTNSSANLSASMVRDAQRQLKHDGYYNGDIDGVMGEETHHAIRQYQQDQNLRANGMLDQQTIHSLGISR